ncbi:hypothetical protein GJAV_G00048980 [Gymnothorax javanicus]|nr:hypothetical protein GJAV_G00048980 [Gymnothorax javanicus]
MEKNNGHPSDVDIKSESEEDCTEMSSEPDTDDSSDEETYYRGQNYFLDASEDAKPSTSAVRQFCGAALAAPAPVPSDPTLQPSEVGSTDPTAIGSAAETTGDDIEITALFNLERWNDRNFKDEEPTQHPFSPQRVPGLQLDVTKDYSPLEIFQLFFTEEAIAVLCENTNKNAHRRLLRGKRKLWKDLEPSEMLHYLALTVYQGLMRPHSARDLWKRDQLYSLPFPTSVMPCYRYDAISACLHMSDPAQDAQNDQQRGQPGYDALFRLKPLHDQILSACRAHFHPHQNITIGEHIVGSRSHHSMKWFIKDQPKRWGFKLFLLTDIKTGYNCDFSVYQGRSLTPSGNGLSYDAVMNLIRVPELGTGYHVYVDNFYTSAALFRQLHRVGFGACGPIRESRQGFPRTSRNALPKTAGRGNMRWIRKGCLLFVKWKDTKDVSMCSTIHKAFSGRTTEMRFKSRDGAWSHQKLPVPDAVMDYNWHMGTMEQSDALSKYFTVSDKTMRWYRKLFLNFVDIAVVNSFIIHKELAQGKGRTPLTQKKFREILCRELSNVGKGDTGESDPEAAAETSPLGCFPVAVTDVTISSVREKATRKRLYCVLCYSRKKRNKTIYKCRSCGVPLCIVADRICFGEWHDLRKNGADSVGLPKSKSKPNPAPTAKS